MTIPIVLGPAGMIPADPATVQQTLLTSVGETNPDYTANLPGIMIEDISSTNVAAILECDSALVELVNSITPFGANLFLLNQLAQIYGVQQGETSNTSVYCVFTGTVGFIVPQGFVVSDGTYQYTVQDGGIIGSGGITIPLYCLATVGGSWPVAANTVTALATSVPSTITLSVNNPAAGTPSAGGITTDQLRAQVLQAGLAASMGMARYLKTLLGNVSGVQQRLISVLQSGSSWLILVGGGDPYQVAYAIYQSIFDLRTLGSSQINVLTASKAAAAVITTDLTHNFTTGATATIAGALGMTGINGSWTVTVITPTSFSIPYNSTSAPTYTGGGIVTPNIRNQSISVIDYPNTYTVPFVVPPAQSVSIGLTWNTIATTAVSATSMATLGAVGLVNYVNSIATGQPMNLFELQNAFQLATASVLPTTLLTRMVFAVTIDGVSVSPAAGTGVIAGDPQSYFLTNATLITITQG